jgi:hypothetical protein
MKCLAHHVHQQNLPLFNVAHNDQVSGEIMQSLRQLPYNPALAHTSSHNQPELMMSGPPVLDPGGVSTGSAGHALTRLQSGDTNKNNALFSIEGSCPAVSHRIQFFGQNIFSFSKAILRLSKHYEKSYSNDHTGRLPSRIFSNIDLNTCRLPSTVPISTTNRDARELSPNVSIRPFPIPQLFDLSASTIHVDLYVVLCNRWEGEN